MLKTVMGIESSCDETSAAIVREGRELLSNIVSSQVDVHSNHGGVMPEVASRMHVESILGVTEESLLKAKLGFDDIDAVAVTQGPGLIGSLLVGLAAAKTFSFALGKPLIGVNHLEAHISAIHLENSIDFPFVALITSGGHTNLFLVRDFTEFEPIGKTRDDAAGEAFDKAAKLLGLGYPGGMIIDNLAKTGNREKYSFPIPFNKKGTFDFSFSGIKTSLAYFLRDNEIKNEDDINDICASYQEAIVKSLLFKSIGAAESYGVNSLVICGGVACNSRLRELGKELCDEKGINLYYPSPSLCTDNAAMIASIGYFRLKAGQTSDLFISSYSTSRQKIIRGKTRFN